MRAAIVLAMVCFFGCLGEARANQLSLSFGPSLDGNLSQKKMLTTSYEFIWGELGLAIEYGAISELGGMNFYGGFNPGVHVVTESGWTARIGFGPVCFSRIDDRLSSLPEFHIQAQLGLDAKYFEAGARFDHFSNGGIWPPNLGLDMASIYLGFPL